MAGTNGYGTLAQLKAVRRLEADYTDWPVMTMRIQALTDAEVRLITQYSKDADSDGETDLIRDRNAQIAFGLAIPDLKPHEDLAAAVAVVEGLPAGVRASLSAAILALTYRPPSQAFKDFPDGTASPGGAAVGPSTTSTSADA